MQITASVIATVLPVARDTPQTHVKTKNCVKSIHLSWEFRAKPIFTIESFGSHVRWRLIEV